jgi:hypothetical protein
MFEDGSQHSRGAFPRLGFHWHFVRHIRHLPFSLVK